MIGSVRKTASGVVRLIMVRRVPGKAAMIASQKTCFCEQDSSARARKGRSR